MKRLALVLLLLVGCKTPEERYMECAEKCPHPSQGATACELFRCLDVCIELTRN